MIPDQLEPLIIFKPQWRTYIESQIVYGLPFYVKFALLILFIECSSSNIWTMQWWDKSVDADQEYKNEKCTLKK